MTPLNRAFTGAVATNRAWLNDLLKRAKVNDFVYPSKHLAERMVERHIEPVDVLRMLVPVIQEFRASTFNQRTFLSVHRGNALVSAIQLGVVSGKRLILIKTVYDRYNEEDYDVVCHIK